MQCQSCGSRVAAGARACAVCGAVVSAVAPASLVPTLIGKGDTLAYASPYEGNALRASGTAALSFPAVAGAGHAEVTSGVCPTCGESLEQEARFCSFCGTTVADIDEPADPVATMPEPVEIPTVLHDASPERADVDTVIDQDAERTPVPTVLRFEPRAAPPPSRAEEPIPEPVAPPVTAAEPVAAAAVQTIVVPSPGRDLSKAVALLAVIGLVAALVVHATAPAQAAVESSVLVQLRAIEWLLGGVLVALVGLLLKR